MRKIKDHYSGYLFDPWYHVGAKRLNLLKNSWAGIFQEHCLPFLPIEKITSRFHETMGRPSKELYTASGAVILQQIFDLSDEETLQAVAFNEMWHFALDIHDPTDENSYLCLRTLWKYRMMATKENIEDSVFQRITDRLKGHFKVDTDTQRIDSVHVVSNMKKLGRVRIFANTIKAFLTDIGRRFP
ncbi:MAG: transposase [Candidatus Xenobiia bacterium LiM19]